MSMAAAALQPLRNPNMHGAIYPGFDLQDTRYPILTQSKSAQRANALILGTNDRSDQDNPANVNDDSTVRRSYEPQGIWGPVKPAWVSEQRSQQYGGIGISADVQSLGTQSQQSQSQEPQRSMLSYALPPGTRRVIERYSLDDNNDRAPSRASVETRLQDNENIITSSLPKSSSQDRSTSTMPRQPLLIPGTISTGSGNTFSMPLPASPSYNPPVAPNPRAYAQQPTYITPPTTPTPIKTIYSPPPPEEICVECAMRDQDMADVDVTSPGVWERQSDAAFEELKQRELENEMNGLASADSSKRPRVKGGRLTEKNLEFWLSVNPREPTSRQQTLKAYIISQRTLLEAEALAHARAQKEARQIENKMRDTYSQLRRSAYDLGNSNPVEDTGRLRIKPPQSTSFPRQSHSRSHSREVTLLENGMIVEHVDVRKEAKEAKERRRKEERRARKSSRSSTLDVGSIISANSLGPVTDSGVGLNIYPRYSQASFSDVHSLGSVSPRRTRFFGVKNLSSGWRSQDSLAPSAMSGSMVDMHLALQQEGRSQSPPDPSTLRRSRLWTSAEPETTNTIVETRSGDKSKKKKGLAKIWDMVTGSGKTGSIASRELSKSLDKPEDDLPLAPPPPLSYLVSRGPSELRAAGGRHLSTPILHSFPSSKPLPIVSASPSPRISGVLPSPPSSRLSAPDAEIVEVRKTPSEDNENQQRDDAIGKSQTKSVHPVISEPNIRQRLSQNIPTPVPPVPVFSRDKSLPPLPGEPRSRAPMNRALDSRPRTVYSYDPRQRPPGTGPAHDFLPPDTSFRTLDARRQSFGGLSSRPNLAAQTLPVNSKQPRGYDHRLPFGTRYNELGVSRRSLGPLGQFHVGGPIPQTPASTPKWKSKFGLGLFLGKKSITHDPEYISPNTSLQFPSINSAGDDDLTANSYPTSSSRHSGGRRATRVSMNFRKVEELVAQDPQFVAYRYPSSDQRLDLL